MLNNMTLEIKRNDLRPALEATITDQDATFNTVESWRVLIGRTRQSTIVDSNPDVEVSDDGHTAVVTHQWAAGQTDLTGTMNVEVEAMWPGDFPQTFPFEGYITVDVHSDLVES